VKVKRRIEAWAPGWVAIDANGVRHYAALVQLRLRACDERPVAAVEQAFNGEYKITCLRCASMELP
jgi:hypothetical protein